MPGTLPKAKLYLVRLPTKRNSPICNAEHSLSAARKCPSFFSTCGSFPRKSLLYIVKQITDGVNRAPPPGKAWTKENLWRDEVYQPKINIAMGYLNLVLDILIFFIPLRASWNLQMGLRWKAKMMAVFGTGALAVVAAILSCYVRASSDFENDRSWTGGLSQVYGSVEIYISLIVACVPPTAFFWRKSMLTVQSTLSSRFPSHFSSPNKTPEANEAQNTQPVAAPRPSNSSSQKEGVSRVGDAGYYSDSTRFGDSETETKHQPGSAV